MSSFYSEDWNRNFSEIISHESICVDNRDVDYLLKSIKKYKDHFTEIKQIWFAQKQQWESHLRERDDQICDLNSALSKLKSRSPTKTKFK
jgi:hypothetical protein